MTKEFTKLDTTIVQARSLLNFMYALGYTLDEDCKTGRFVTKSKVHQGNKYLSAATAIKMHNLKDSQWEVHTTFPNGSEVVFPSGAVKLSNGFTGLGVRLAMASKLVAEVKLSVTRTGQLVTQDVMIKPLNEDVRQMVEPSED